MTEKKLTPEVLAILSKPFAVEDHELRDGGRDGKLVYITEGPLLERLTEADPDWEFDVIKSDVIFPGDGPAFVRELGRLTICGVSRVSSGTGFANVKTREWDQKQKQMVKLDEPVIFPLSEMEAKGATTDTLKRCARLFRIGAYLLDTKGEKFQNDADFQRWYIREFGKPAAPHTRGADQARSVTNQMTPDKSSGKRTPAGQKTDTPAPGDAVLDAHFGPRNPAKASMADEMPENADDAARARDRAQKTFPFAKDDKLTPWTEFMASHRTWHKKFWPAAKALGFATNDAVHAALGVDSMKDVQGATGMMWLALVKAAPPEQMELDPTGTDG